MPNQEQVKQFIEALEDAGYEPKSYSGRGMFGKECVSLRDSEDERISVWDVAKCLFGEGRDGEFDNVPEPREDQLGRGIVLYWPSYEWPQEEKIIHNGSMCPGESCPKCRKARGEDINNPRVIELDGAWQIIFRNGSKFASDEIIFAKGQGNG